MDVRKDVMSEFLGTKNAVFVVPVYQRNYDWGKPQCQRLFDDMAGTVRTGQQHFMGTICFKMEGDRKRFVVDGQQRLTSVTLLMKALRDFVDDVEIRHEVETTYLKNTGVSVANDEFAKVKLHLNGHDDMVHKLLLSCDRDSIESRILSPQRNSGVYRNYVLFYDMISKYVEDGGDALDLMNAMEQLCIVSLIVESENQQEIFESLNSTGLDLTSVDLLRNNLLMRFPYDIQSEFYENYWRRVEELVGTDNMLPFLLNYLIVKRKHHQINAMKYKSGDAKTVSGTMLVPTVEDVLKRFVSGDTFYERMKSFFEDLLSSAKLYKDLVFYADFELKPDTPLLRRTLYFLVVGTESTNANALVLYLMRMCQDGKITQAELQRACDAVLSMVFRCKICRHTGITAQFTTSVIQRLEHFVPGADFMKAFWPAITSGRGLFAFPPDAEFADALLHADVYNSRLRAKGIRYFFYALEEASPYRKGLPAFVDETITVEHIMPQKLSLGWKKSLSDDSLSRYDQFVHTCGNLALTSYNGEMSNKTLAEKQAFYQHSNFYYTRLLADMDDWQVSDIENRAKKLVADAIHVWALPAEYQTAPVVVAGSSHRLDEDSSMFTHLKPIALESDGVEVSVRSWRELSFQLAKLLKQTDESVMDTLARMAGMPLIVMSDADCDYESDRKYKACGGGMYVMVHGSAQASVQNMYRLVEAFDKIAQTDMLSQITFRVK